MPTGIYVHKERHSLIKGQRFYNLTVIKFSHREPYPHGCIGFKYLCICDCGKKKIINKRSLLDGSTRSCGFYRNKRVCETKRLKYGDASLNHLLGNKRGNAKRRNLEWKLTKEYFYLLSKSPCYYCGTKPFYITNEHKSFYFGATKHNGIDRINSDKGYIKGNVVPCCLNCNHAKGTLSTKEFLTHIKKIYEYNQK